jgi:hypothetical protein
VAEVILLPWPRIVQAYLGLSIGLLLEFLATEITKEGWYSFLLLRLKVSFLCFSLQV